METQLKKKLRNINQNLKETTAEEKDWIAGLTDKAKKMEKRATNQAKWRGEARKYTHI